MKTNFGSACAVAVCAGLCVLTASSAARAQGIDVLKVIPSSADGFVVAGKLADLDKKNAAQAKKMGLPAAGMGLFDALPKIGFDEGIDRDGSGAVFFMGGVNERETVIGVLPTTSFQKVVDATNAQDAGGGLFRTRPANGPPLVFAKKGNFLFFCDDRERDRNELAAALKHEENVVAQVKPLERWLAEQDVAGVALEKTVKAVAKLARKIPDQLPGIPDDQQEALKAYLEWARGLARSVSEEVGYVALGGRIDGEDNIRISLRAGYVKDGRFSKGAVPPKLHPLAGVPGGPYVMALGTTISPETMQSLMDLSGEATKKLYKLTDAEAKKLASMMGKAMNGVQSMSGIVHTPKQDESLFSGMLMAYKVDDSKEFLATYVEATVAGYELMKVPTTTTKVRLGEMPAVELKMDITALIKKENEDPQTADMMKKFFGDDKLSISFVAVDPKTILMGYVPAARMKQLADGYAGGKMLVADPTTAKTLKLLPENPWFVMLVSPKETAGFVAKFSKDFGLELPIPPIAETPPVGIGSRSDATTIELQLVVPAEVVVELSRLAKAANGF